MSRDGIQDQEAADFGTGSTGGWTDEEVEEAEADVHATPEGAQREDDDPEALREGRAKANRPTDEAEPYAKEGRVTDEPSNRRGMHPREE